MNEGKALDWGICGVGVMPADRAMQEALDAQDGLYTLVVKHADGTYRAAGDRLDRRVPVRSRRSRGGRSRRMAAESTRIVSLTVTEGGYNIDHVTGEFDGANPAVVADLRSGTTPQTSFGFVTEALRRRREPRARRRSP